MKRRKAPRTCLRPARVVSVVSMRGQPYGRVIAGLLAWFVWVDPHTARACSCLPPEPPALALSHADAVFEGRVLSLSAVAPEDAAFGGELRYELELQRVWKGELPDVVVLTTPSSSAACGRSFEIGGRYLVYAARGQRGELADFLCSRTRRISGADEDLAVLGPARARAAVEAPRQDREPRRIEPPPAPAAQPPPSARGCAIADDPLPAPAALGLLALALLARRRRRPRVGSAAPNQVQERLHPRKKHLDERHF